MLKEFSPVSFEPPATKKFTIPVADVAAVKKELNVSILNGEGKTLHHWFAGAPVDGIPNLSVKPGLQEVNRKPDNELSLRALDHALDAACEIRKQRNETYRATVPVWEKGCYSRAEEANGRKYLNAVDEVKDHLPMCTVDLSYLIYRELLLPPGKWYDQDQAARNQYAKSHGLPSRADKPNWKDYKTLAH